MYVICPIVCDNVHKLFSVKHSVGMTRSFQIAKTVGVILVQSIAVALLTIYLVMIV